MANGTVKFFNATKGFGFITPEDGGKDVFVPALSVSASGIPTLKPGQAVSFETEPDGKGPKAVQLKVLSDAPKPAPVPAPAVERPAIVPQTAPPRLTVFHDPSSDTSRLVLAALETLGEEPRLLDYIATPPDREALKNLSLLMRGGDQSLVRKYDPLFLELRLDDRFISDGEFWGAIVEHPSLINGPVLATPQKARVCRTEQAVKAFLGIGDDSQAAAKPKGLPGRAVPAPVVKAEEVKKTEAIPVKAPPAGASKKPVTEARAETRAKPKAKVAAKAPAKAKIKIVAKPKAKPAAKSVKVAKKAVATPVKKAGRK